MVSFWLEKFYRKAFLISVIFPCQSEVMSVSLILGVAKNKNFLSSFGRKKMKSDKTLTLSFNFASYWFSITLSNVSPMIAISMFSKMIWMKTETNMKRSQAKFLSLASSFE